MRLSDLSKSTFKERKNTQRFLVLRSGWQKKVDAHLRGVTGKSTLKTLTPVELMSVALKSDAKMDAMAADAEMGGHLQAEFKNINV